MNRLLVTRNHALFKHTTSLVFPHMKKSTVISDKYVKIHENEMSTKIKILKTISLTSCIGSVCAAPAILQFSSPDIPFAGKAIMAGSFLFFGVTTTSLLHVCTEPFVHNLYKRQLSKEERELGAKDQYIAETMTIFGRKILKPFNINDVIEPRVRPFITFSTANENFFLQTKKVNDAELADHLQDLIGEELVVPDRDFSEKEL